MSKIPDNIWIIMQLLIDNDARDVLIVGGFVRDSLLGIESKDIDIEVYGLSIDRISQILIDHGYRVDLVGKSFGVLKVNNSIDISVPRRENKIGIGHKGFEVIVDPDMSITEAASRRDFTINSMAMNIHGNIIDPWHGQVDLHTKCLRATCSERFVEDPLRVMRAMQFVSRFDLWIHPETEELCRMMAPQKSELPKERIWEEWKKWALKGAKPSHGLAALSYSSWLDPEINALMEVPQDKEWHPEGNVFVHTCHVVDAAAEIAEREQLDNNDRMVLMFAALCHDFGKPSTTQVIDRRWRSPGHCEAGVEPARNFLERIGAPNFIIEQVLPLIKEHLSHINQPSKKAIRRLANRLAPASIKMLSHLVESDQSGRPPLPKHNPFQVWLDVANSMDLSSGKPQPILMGRHLIDMGMFPGKVMGDMLSAAFEAQLDGEINDLSEAMEWARGRMGS